MKYLITACLFVFFATACSQKPQNEGDGVTARPAQVPGTDGITESKMALDTITGKPYYVEKPVDALSSAISENPKRIMDNIAPVMRPLNAQTAQAERVQRVLTTELWAVWSLVRIKKVEETRINQGAWFQFKPDGTYEYGFWDEPISSGTWYFDGATGLLDIDSKLKGDDRQWKVQMASSEDVMVWTGTEKHHTTDITLKLHRFYNVPKTRAELGVSE